MTSTLSAVPAGLFNYNANDQLSTDVYDSNGNTISSGGVADSYDFENHLTQYGLVNLVYDGDGNRVSETIGGTTTGYVVDSINPTGYPQVLEEIVNGAVQRKYTWGHWLLSENQLNSGTWTKNFYLYDGHGSVRNLTDASGNITDSYTYDAFGNLIESSGTTANNYLFAGEQYDPVLNLYYNRARYLNTNTGRFWSMDTHRELPSDPSTMHRYLYVRDNPVDRIDRLGLQDEIEELGAEADAEVLGATEGEIQPVGAAVEELTQEATVDLAEDAASADEGETAQEAEEAEAESTVTQPLKITDDGLKHIAERHIPGGARTAGKSLFDVSEDINGLLQAGENVNPVQQVGGNFERVIDAGRQIGVDRLTGPTSTYTIITNAAGEVVTAFPGLP